MKVGLVGKVLGHSWSSKIHEAFFKEMGITGSYELIEVPQDKIDHFFCLGCSAVRRTQCYHSL